MSKYFNGDKLSGYEDSPITYVHGNIEKFNKGVVMEEKERYEIHIYDDICVDLYDNGVLDKSINDTYKLEELLNQQDKQIKAKEKEANTYAKEIVFLDNKIKQLKQSQKQVAIEELKKVKEYNHTLSLGGSPYVDVFIDNQIKSLKGESKGDVGE